MKKEDLFQAFNNIDEQFIEEALQSQPKKKFGFVKGFAVALSVLICVTVGIKVIYNQKASDKTMVVISHTSGQTTIEQQEDIYSPVTSASSIMYVNNGEIRYSQMLNGALKDLKDEYQGKKVSYKVIVYMFKDGNRLADNDYRIQKEVNRLTLLGYQIPVNNYEVDQEVSDVLVIYMSYKQLMDFSINEEYGYYLTMYGEGYTPTDEVAY